MLSALSLRRLSARCFVLLACALLAVPVAVDWLSYAYVFRDMRRGAERRACYEFAKRVAPGVRFPRRYRPPAYGGISEWPPRSGAYAGKRSAYRVTLQTHWQSPVFRLRRTISASTTVALLPTDRPDEAQIAAVE